MICENIEQVETETSRLDIASMKSFIIDDIGCIDNYKAIYNNTQEKYCCIVSERYNLVQHKEFFDSFVRALDKLNIGYEISFMTKGNSAIADIMFKDRNLKFEKLDEEFMTGIRLMNSFDRRSGITIAPRFTRLACSNGMLLSRFEKSFSVIHSSADAKTMESLIEKRITQIINHDIDLEKWINESLLDNIEWNNACKVINKLVPKITHQKGILKNLNIEVSRDKKTKQIEYDNKSGVVEFNRWQLYNAATSYITHGDTITPLMEELLHNNTQKLLFEKLQTIKV